jgi:predicted nucleic acid-binding protein
VGGFEITVCDLKREGRGGRRTAPYAFTEQGVAMLSSVLGSPRAIAVNIETMRTFVRVRALVATHCDLAKRLAELEEKTEALAMNHDTFSHNTRAQLKKVFDALRELLTPRDPPKRPIGFVTPEDKSSKKTSVAKGQDLTPKPDELAHTLGYSKFAARIDSFDTSIAALVAQYTALVSLVAPASVPRVVANDADDDHVIAAAVAARAALIATGDRKHLLPIGSHQCIAIVTARQVIDRLDARRKT